MLTADTSPPVTEYTPTPTYASVARTQELARARKYQHLRSTLLSTDPSENQKTTPLTLQSLLSDPDLDLADLRKLFGALRRAFLVALWEHRQVNLWIKRATNLGVDYAMAVAEDENVAKYPSRYVFFREMDEGLDVGDGGAGREEIVGLILRHVQAYRETMEEVRGRMGVMDGLLRGWDGDGV